MKKRFPKKIGEHNLTSFKAAVAEAYNSHRFDIAETGIIKLVNYDRRNLESYYVALKTCFLARNFRDPLFEIFDNTIHSQRAVRYLKYICGINFVFLLLLHGDRGGDIAVWFLLSIPLNIIGIVLLGGSATYRLVTCTTCLKSTLLKSNLGENNCLQCGSKLRADIYTESILFATRNADETEQKKLLEEIELFSELCRTEKNIRSIFFEMKYNYNVDLLEIRSGLKPSST